MSLKKSSLIFLLILFIILVFIIGVRYGQRVEKTNKTINYLISLPPSPSPQPTQIPLEFKTFSNKVCGISFLYPQHFKVKIASQEAIFKEDAETKIELSCSPKNKMAAILEDEKTASGELTFKAKKIPIKTIDKGQTYVLKFLNPKNAKTIFVSISKSLYPFFEKSLEFIL